MSLAALIRKGGLAMIANANPAKPANDGQGKAGPLAGLAPFALANSRSPEVVPLPDPAAEARRQRVLATLAERPGVRYAVLTDIEADPDAVLLILAILGRATCELRVPRAKYDPFLLLDLIERHDATLH